jgi:thioesterase domain-containing protein
MFRENCTNPVIFFPGAGGRASDLTPFQEGPGDPTRFEFVVYPGWRRYVEEGFSAEALIEELEEQIAAKVPEGPIRMVGVSLGGHLGYALALRFQSRGREIEGFCAIDAFMVDSAEPRAGWKSRAMAELVDRLGKGQFGKFALFFRERFWRALLRLANERLPGLLRKHASSGWLTWLLKIDSVAEEETSMRLLLRETAPWVASLDRDPAPLRAPAKLLRGSASAADDAAWLRRCPGMEIHALEANHHSLLDPENAGSLREAFLKATRERRRANSSPVFGD